MYICTTCHYASATKLGKCPNCGEFGTFMLDPEHRIKDKKKGQGQVGKTISATQESSQPTSYPLKHAELDRIYSDGIKSSGVYLIAGEPGIGKSTIVLQIIQALVLNSPNINVGYFTGEESVTQVSARVTRILGSIPSQLHIYYSNSIQDCITTAQTTQCDIMIIDSIQMIASNEIESSSGTPAQVKAVAEAVAHDCKSSTRAALLIGHVTKGGEIAGPKYLEHIVDVVSYLEGDRYGHYRFLRNKKNRFGSADETAIFEMTSEGLISVRDMTSANLGMIQTGQAGTVVSVGLDSGRPMVVGVECLCTKTKMSFPKRLATGRNPKRLDLMIAIIEKYCKLNLSFFDVYCNVPGEVKIMDHGIDLAVIAGIISSAKGIALPDKTLVIGEVGLGGQILPSKSHSKRLNELPGYTLIDYQTITHVRQLASHLSLS